MDEEIFELTETKIREIFEEWRNQYLAAPDDFELEGIKESGFAVTSTAYFLELHKTMEGGN